MKLKESIAFICLLFIFWDVATTYMGTVALFTPSGGDMFFRIKNAPIFVHVVAGLFAVGLIVFILAYKQIMRAGGITKPILYVCFVYDFATSFYGTKEALLVQYNASGGFVQLGTAQLAVILLISIMATSAPILMSQIIND